MATTAEPVPLLKASPKPNGDAPLILVLGASGYVGGRLVPQLLDAGYRVRCLARSPAKLTGMPWAAAPDSDDDQKAQIVKGDLFEPDTLTAAFEGADSCVYLVHSMAGPGDFAARDRRAAHNAVAAAETAGVQRIVYLGGLGEIDESTSQHLRSRAEVGDILGSGSVPATTLRAAVIIGSGSASFEMLRHLVEKLPVMVVPRWVDTRIQPVAIRDVLRALVGVVGDFGEADHVYDLGGPDVLNYLELMQTYARVAGLPRRRTVKVPILSPGLSSHWVNLVTPVPFAVAQPLVDSLTTEVVVSPGGEDIATVIGAEPAPLSAADAIKVALARVHDQQVETSWRDADLAGRDPAGPYPGDPDWSGGSLYCDTRTASATCAPEFVYDAAARLGGERGWPTYQWAWQLRGFADRMVGGVGLRRGRRDPDHIRVGDALDFWRVEDAKPPLAAPVVTDDPADLVGLLRLRAEMRLPGRAWLEFCVEPDGDGARLTQRALFAPRGVLGRAYWAVLVPFHGPIFSGMAKAVVADAQALAAAAEAAPAGGLPRHGGRADPRR